MKITTWNVNGLRARQGQLVELLERDKPDVVCLQEIKASLTQVPEALHGLEGYWRYWHGAEGGYSGVALLVKKALVPHHPKFSHPAFDHENRIVTVELGDLTIASVYVPNGGKDFDAKMRFMNSMERWVATGRPLILCGDLNVALTSNDVHERYAGPNVIGQSIPERELMAKVLGHGLVDLMRSFHPDDKALFTWWAPWRQHKERNIGWRLDYMLVSEGLAKRATACDVDRMFGTSDHGPVTGTFEGALFDADAVAAGAEQVIPPPVEKKKKTPRKRKEE